MTNYYVKTDGKDGNLGTKDRPWQHPSYAALQAVAGDIIYLMGGTWYGEHMAFANPGIASNPITMKAYSGTPTLDGGDKTGTGITTSGRSYIHISGLEIKRYGHAIFLGSSSYNRVSTCHLHDTKDSVVHMGKQSHHNTLEDCDIHTCPWNIVQLRGKLKESEVPSHHLSIINNNIHDFPEHNAIDLFGAMHDINIIGNELHNEEGGNKWSGVFSHVWPEFTARKMVTINNNHVHHTYWGLYVSGTDGLIYNNNNVHNTGAWNIYAETPCTNVTGCGNTFDGSVRVKTSDAGRLTAEFFTKPCDGGTGIIPGKVMAKTGLPISGAKITADGYETTTE